MRHNCLSITGRLGLSPTAQPPTNSCATTQAAALATPPLCSSSQEWSFGYYYIIFRGFIYLLFIKRRYRTCGFVGFGVLLLFGDFGERRNRWLPHDTTLNTDTTRPQNFSNHKTGQQYFYI